MKDLHIPAVNILREETGTPSVIVFGWLNKVSDSLEYCIKERSLCLLEKVCVIGQLFVLFLLT